MIKYSHDVGVVIYGNFIGSVGMATNAYIKCIYQYTLINLQQNDDKIEFCCKVGTKRTGAAHGDIHIDCVTLKLLGKTKKNFAFKTVYSYLIFCPSYKVTR